DAMRDNNYRGCAFARASAEGRPGTAATQAVETSRAWLRSLFRDLVVALGVAEPDRLAGQLVLLYDGVTNASLLDRDTEAAATATPLAPTSTPRISRRPSARCPAISCRPRALSISTFPRTTGPNSANSP